MERGQIWEVKLTKGGVKGPGAKLMQPASNAFAGKYQEGRVQRTKAVREVPKDLERGGGLQGERGNGKNREGIETRLTSF